ncbi:hypothetical protein Trichorick_01396 (plasmid) [Candidatus Trichorickettsia mobilis]|uniref:DUF2829 domain-containing protein n=1 Tax=Candidatus Trichorickettsia mobilis TaxID=1346319 RepID=A0ABZ0UV00_9RICK|nr:hypothetical protein [Candidatus Trichorickettsia mobilis]WPY01483.1 hypothetical protein Trichorick_01396 [Candidatus Trichorickettsia mobilis]
MNITEAVRCLKVGKIVKRKDWDISNAIDYNGCDDYTPLFAIDDIDANDWQVVQ